MAKSKYYYMIVDRENGTLCNILGKMAVYAEREVAKSVCREFSETCVVQKIKISDIETLILKSKKA